MPPPKKVQIAFQGGGARVFGHLAVAEALEEFMNSQATQGQVLVTRVAGSSAGALGAVTFASTEQTKDIRERFVKAGKEILPYFSSRGPGRGFHRLWRLCRVFRGKSYFRDINLLCIFQGIFSRPGQIQIKDLRVPSLIYYSDLNTKRLRSSPQDETIVQALAFSCNFPFVFSGWDDASDRLDGGLTQNLPVDELVSGQSDYGEVIAIAFCDETTTEQNNSFFGHIQKMFATSIEASVQRSINLIGNENIFRINTDISTFDFEKAVQLGFGDHYVSIRNDFKDWLGKWIAKRSDNTRWVKPMNVSSIIPDSFFKEIDISRGQPAFQIEEASVIDIAEFDNGDVFSERYTSRLRTTATPLRELYVVKFEIELEDAEWIGRSGLRCAAWLPNGDPVPMDIYVHKHNKDNRRLGRYSICFCFRTPLRTNTSYTFEYEMTGHDFYPKVSGGLEYAAFEAMQGDAKSLTIVVALPKSICAGTLTESDLSEATDDILDEVGGIDKNVLVSSKKLEYVDVSEKLRLTGRQHLYTVIARQGSCVARGNKVGILLDSR